MLGDRNYTVEQKWFGLAVALRQAESNNLSHQFHYLALALVVSHFQKI